MSVKVVMILGKVRHTSIVRDREQALNEIKINLFPLQKKGDSLVWTKSSSDIFFVDTVTIVKSNGDITQNSAQILTGGTEVAKAKKVTKEKKTEPEVKITKKTTPEKKEVKKPTPVKKEMKKAGPSKKEQLAKAILTLPKVGKTIEQLITQSAMNKWDVKLFADFSVLLGVTSAKNGKYYPA